MNYRLKSQMEIVKAQHIIDNGKMMDSNIAGYPINIDNKWYFEGEIFDRTISDKTEDKE